MAEVLAPSYPIGLFPELEPFLEVVRRDLQLRRVTQRIAYAATITPDAEKGEFVVVDTLTGNLIVANPINARESRKLTFQFTQDGSGGHTVTFGTDFVDDWTPDTSAGAVQVVSFWYDGVTKKWVQLAADTTTFSPGSHVIATTAGLGTSHTTSGLTAGQVLRATGATTAAFQALLAGDLPTHTHPASQVSAGTFGAGDYVFPADLIVQGGGAGTDIGTEVQVGGAGVIAFNRPAVAFGAASSAGILQWFVDDDSSGEGNELAAEIDFVGTAAWDSTDSDGQMEFRVKPSADLLPLRVLYLTHGRQAFIDDGSTNDAQVPGIVISASSASGDYPDGTIWVKV